MHGTRRCVRPRCGAALAQSHVPYTPARECTRVSASCKSRGIVFLVCCSTVKLYIQCGNGTSPSRDSRLHVSLSLCKSVTL